ncbi:cation diffusion facilitator family transporter [Ideonella sp.]|uniref:cation diffusion facilitator family transporter n=1 Tax=Ideonella sp. TaxID=1929293 RepID=UPI003BB648C1
MTGSNGHHDHHDHHHGHHHGHHHALPADAGRAFIIAIVLNTGFVALEFAYGVLANSTALMADAGHNLSDVLGLLLAWGATLLARRPADQRYTYGLRGSSILAALVNATLLLLACGAIAWEAVQRIGAPPAVASTTVMTVAAIGIFVNGASAWLFLKGSKGDLNQRGAYLHLMADAAVSLGVVLAGLVMRLTGWFWLDPVLSLVIVAVIVVGTWGLLRESLQLVLQAVPTAVDLPAVAAFLRAQPGVEAVSDLHVWALSTRENALTARLQMPAGHPGDAVLAQMAASLAEHHAIHHSTLQVMLAPEGGPCALAEAAPEVPRCAHGHAH